MFTLSGAHVFPMYDGAVKADPPMRLLDVRHEQTAVFAAEAVGKLTRTPGLAVLTAGPGITNGVSPITQASFSGAPLVVVGGRAPDNRWGRAACRSSTTSRCWSRSPSSRAPCTTRSEVAAAVDEAFTVARSPHRGPTFLDVPMDVFFDRVDGRADPAYAAPARGRARPRRDRRRSASCSPQAERPVLVIGCDVWADGAEEAALRLVESTRASRRSPTAWAAASSRAATRC